MLRKYSRSKFEKLPFEELKWRISEIMVDFSYDFDEGSTSGADADSDAAERKAGEAGGICVDRDCSWYRCCGGRRLPEFREGWRKKTIRAALETRFGEGYFQAPRDPSGE